MGNSLTLEEIKAKIDILKLATNYGFEFNKPHGSRYRASKNLLRDEKTSSLDFFEDSQKFYDRGTGSGGDCIDLVQAMENISQAEAIQKIKSMVGEDAYSVEKREYKPYTKEPKEKKEVDFYKLQYISQKELSNNLKNKPFVYEMETVAQNGFIQKQGSLISITNPYRKLFETDKLEIEYQPKIDTLFKTIIGFSDFWNSPTIILKDRKDKVIDIVAYRPKSKETGEEIKGMKYYYKNQNNRGEEFVYPFENLVKHIAKREKYIVIGEGLKNAVNALLYGVPFISIESTSNVRDLNPKLIEAINDFINNGYGLVTAFDGDKVGEKAYHEFLSLTGFSAENIFSFESNIDFVEYVMGTEK